MTLRLRVSGRVTDTQLRYTAAGVPVLSVQLDDADTKQAVRVRIQFKDASHSSKFIAGAQRARYRNQSVSFEAINPRFKRGRMDCEASELAGLQVFKAEL